MPGRKISQFSSKIVKLITVLLVVAVLLFAGLVAFYKTQLKAVSSDSTPVIVTIASGSDIKTVAATLKQAGVIRNSTVFEWYSKLNKKTDIKSGTYRIAPNVSAAAVLDTIIEGKVALDLFTILPAQRIDQIRKAFLDSGFAEAAVDEALKPALYASHPVFAGISLPVNLEGFLYPESFYKSADTSPQTIIKLSLDEMAKRLTPDVRQGFAAQGLSIYQGITLASIVEQEVHGDADRKQAAQVFLLRIKKNMDLGSDVTAFYGSRMAGVADSVAYDTPYNTRLHPGLPPTPISNVSLSSMEAVAKPAAGDYLFFVAGDDGKTYFSHTVAEHEALTKQHCHELCQ